MQGLIPAHAGKTCRGPCCACAWRAHPRSRGENLRPGAHAGRARGSSPLTRGKRRTTYLHENVGRLIPAHAGKTLGGLGEAAQGGAHPRSRGENLIPTVMQLSSVGSSPLTRGKPSSCTLRPRTARLIPAHAGKTSRASRTSCQAPAHPRSRGENPSLVTHSVGVSGSSPLTRGKPLARARGDRRRRLIPAHAGKTMRCRHPTAQGAAHPRSRGENRILKSSARKKGGSSPLTRGKRTGRAAGHAARGLIPAHAGKT